jgi:DNA-binding transcriptional LysR family regulator
LQNRISDFDFDLLLAFDALLKEQNVTHAAVRLNITQSALSARLSRLRLLLNDPLFVTSTSGRGIVPTSHAAALAPESARLIDHLNDFISTAHLFDPATSKRVFRIAATDNPSAILAPDLIPLIKSQAPFTKIAFTLPDKANIAEHLEQGELDLFIGTKEDGSGELIGRTLFEEKFVTAQRRDHPRGTGPMSLDEFCRLDHLLISTSGGRFSGMIDDALAEIGRERHVSVSMQNYGLAPLVLTSTDCICTLPSRFLKRFEHILDFVKPPLELARFDMHLFWHSRTRKDPAHIWLRKQVMQVAQGNKE